jgi:hypothetical protein
MLLPGMLNFTEQTGSGAVIVVWSFLFVTDTLRDTAHSFNCFCRSEKFSSQKMNTRVVTLVIDRHSMDDGDGSEDEEQCEPDLLLYCTNRVETRSTES